MKSNPRLWLVCELVKGTGGKTQLTFPSGIDPNVTRVLENQQNQLLFSLNCQRGPGNGKGPPGSGKTTLLKHIALMLAQGKRPYRVARMSHTVPILLYLREYGSSIKDNPDFSLLDAVKEHMQKKWQQLELSQWIHHCLTKGKCLILLDGLDEVADHDARQWIVKWLERQMTSYMQNRFILTSRPHGYRDNPLASVTVLEVRPFKPKQIKRFIYKWYLANELKSWGKEDLGVHMRAQEGAQDLLLKERKLKD